MTPQRFQNEVSNLKSRKVQRGTVKNSEIKKKALCKLFLLFSFKKKLLLLNTEFQDFFFTFKIWHDIYSIDYVNLVPKIFIQNTMVKLTHLKNARECDTSNKKNCMWTLLDHVNYI